MKNPLYSVYIKENANAGKNETNMGSINKILKKMSANIITKTITKTVIIKFDLFFIFKILSWLIV